MTVPPRRPRSRLRVHRLLSARRADYRWGATIAGPRSNGTPGATRIQRRVGGGGAHLPRRIDRRPGTWRTSGTGIDSPYPAVTIWAADAVAGRLWVGEGRRG